VRAARDDAGALIAMPDTVTIRTAVLEDAPRLADLSGVLGYPASATTLAGRLERLLGRPEHILLVAELPGGPVVGWLHASEQDLLETGLRAEIVGLVVDADHRGLGVGRRLVARVEEWAAARGLEHLHVRSNVARLESHPFYERLGYVKVKTQHAYRKVLGTLP
jgi:ribosomal protein S18 acetylase RimI-like enzyme